MMKTNKLLIQRSTVFALAMVVFSSSNCIADGQTTEDDTQLLFGQYGFYPFDEMDEDFELKDLDWRLNVKAFQGVPHDYAIASIQYVEKAIELLSKKGKVPKRKCHRLKSYESKGRDISPAAVGVFPKVVNISETYEIASSIELFPEPEIIRGMTSIPQEIAQKGKQSSKTNKLIRSPFWATVFFVPSPKEKNEVPETVTPKGYATLFGIWSTHCKQFMKGSYLHEFTTFPDSFDDDDVNSSKFPVLGMLASFNITPQNNSVRLICFKDRRKSVTWIGYRLVDANGALRRIEKNGVVKGKSCLRPMKCVFCPMFKDTQDRIPPQSLLLTNFGSARITDASEHWVLPSTYYSEHKIPVWGLWATEDSKPWQENFELHHATKESSGELWKVVIFPDTKPVDLVRAIARFKQIPKNKQPSESLIKRKLSSFYENVLKVRKRYHISETKR